VRFQQEHHQEVDGIVGLHTATQLAGDAAVRATTTRREVAMTHPVTTSDHTRRTVPDLAARLAHAYGALMRGLLWTGSEGDDPFHSFSAPFDATSEVTPETFRGAVGIGGSWAIQLDTADAWFAEMIQYFHDNQYSGDDHGTELVYAHLQRAMIATLDGPLQMASVHYSPANGSSAFHKARYYVFGRVAEGGLAGLMAYSVET
jgi:hypothetical protein